MSNRRTIWLVAGSAVLLAAIAVLVREANGPGREDAPGLVNTMMALLEQDPRLNTAETKQAVQDVADLVEQGRLDTAQGHYALGLHRCEQCSFDAAERAFRRAVALEPQWVWPHNALGILLANHTEGRTTEAEDAFRKAIELDPTWSRPHNDFAILLRLSGKLEEAETEALTALRLDPGSVATRNNYGNLLVVQKRYAEAEPQYRQAMALDPAHPKPYYNLACLYCLVGRHDEALALLAKGLELDGALGDYAWQDPDLDALRNDPKFLQLIESAAATATGLGPN